ncbi:unnamed protein product [Penicillium palitans]
MTTKSSSNWSSEKLTEGLTDTTTAANYANGGPFEARTVRRIILGSTNFTYRLFLKTPYTWGQQQVKTAILKYAAPETAMDPRVEFNPERQLYESCAMAKIPWKDIFPPPYKGSTSLPPTVGVPHLYWEDPARRIIIMEDCNPRKDSDVWEERSHSARIFLEEIPESEHKYNTAKVIGYQLGAFLANLHNWGRDPRNTTLVQGSFAGNSFAKALTIQEAFLDFEKSIERIGHPEPKACALKLEKHMHEMQTQVSQNLETMIMGDFWPGNFILAFNTEDDLERLSIIDWEFAMMAPAFVDLGNFIGAVFVNHYFESNDDVYIFLLESFKEAYTQGANHMDIRMIMKYAGAHAIQALARRVNSPRSRATKENAASFLNRQLQYISEDNTTDTLEIALGDMKLNRLSIHTDRRLA